MAENDAGVPDPSTAPVLTLDQLRQKAAAALEGRRVFIPALGGTLRVRALKFADYLAATKAATRINPNSKKKYVDSAEQQRQIIVRGIIEPAMTPAEGAAIIANWSLGVIKDIVSEIMAESGMPLSTPEQESEFEDEPTEGLARVPSNGGGETPGGDFQPGPGAS